ncbi:hypothetical protein HZS_2736 [Henneguya salminicola]|nr:hypothetical protein HZS_2736 [Henneguya salminicola]
MKRLHFIVIDRFDRPIFQENYDFKARSSDLDQDDFTPQQVQLIFFSSLDTLDSLIWKSNQSYFKNIDTFNTSKLSAYVGCGGVKFMLIHDHLQDSVRDFFIDVYESYIRAIQNPLQDIVQGNEIFSNGFSSKIASSIRYRFS